MVEENRRVIFCQGDKKELEEITGEKYDYIKPRKHPNLNDDEKEYANFNTSFGGIWCYVSSEERMKTNLSKVLMRELYDRAVSLDANAVIHYTTQIFQNNDGVYEGFARGTFLQKRKE